MDSPDVFLIQNIEIIISLLLVTTVCNCVLAALLTYHWSAPFWYQCNSKFRLDYPRTCASLPVARISLQSRAPTFPPRR